MKKISDAMKLLVVVTSFVTGICGASWAAYQWVYGKGADDAVSKLEAKLEPRLATIETNVQWLRDSKQGHRIEYSTGTMVIADQNKQP